MKLLLNRLNLGIMRLRLGLDIAKTGFLRLKLGIVKIRYVLALVRLLVRYRYGDIRFTHVEVLVRYNKLI